MAAGDAVSVALAPAQKLAGPETDTAGATHGGPVGVIVAARPVESLLYPPLPKPTVNSIVSPAVSDRVISKRTGAPDPITSPLKSGNAAALLVRTATSV